MTKTPPKNSTEFLFSPLSSKAYLLFLVIKMAMAIALVILVGYLLLELTADAFVLLGSFKTAGTISSRTAQSLLNGGHDLLILIKSYFHYKFSSIIFETLALGT